MRRGGRSQHQARQTSGRDGLTDRTRVPRYRVAFGWRSLDYRRARIADLDVVWPAVSCTLAGLDRSNAQPGDVHSLRPLAQQRSVGHSGGRPIPLGSPLTRTVTIDVARPGRARCGRARCARDVAPGPDSDVPRLGGCTAGDAGRVRHPSRRGVISAGLDDRPAGARFVRRERREPTAVRLRLAHTTDPVLWRLIQRADPREIASTTGTELGAHAEVFEGISSGIGGLIGARTRCRRAVARARCTRSHRALRCRLEQPCQHAQASSEAATKAGSRGHRRASAGHRQG
ncbi:hypothetical protein JF66_10630 [Cryobacterium sp. MLB-32]|nr:hypothetical protein JF66_10630 [Cryobacterium sp. MLB-32]